jgi:putative ABC transport system substrate-binding protein
MMRRREFIALLGGVAAWPVAARAQPRRVRRIGALMGYAESDPEAQSLVAAFRNGLAASGWEVGRNLQIEFRWASADAGRIGDYARELVASRPEVILANTTPVTAAIQRETSEVPIVFVIVSDPVGAGFVASLSRPGANITGFINFEASMGGKWLELLKQVAPATTNAAIMFNPDTAPGGGSYFLDSFEAAGPRLGMKTVIARVRTPDDIESGISNLARQRSGGLVVMTDSFMRVNRRRVIGLAEHYKLPVIYPNSISPREGGLLGYTTDYHDLFRRSAGYVDRILQGTKVSDLPVQVPVKFELVINLKTAKALGLDIPDKLLALADEVIE